MNPGRLSKRITLQKVEGYKINAAGERVPTYKDFASVWANMKPLKGMEYLEAQKIGAENRCKIDIRYSSTTKDVDNTMRVVYKGRELEIESVLNINEADRIIQLRCFERR